MEATYMRGEEEKKKTGHGKMPKEQWMKCTLRMCCWEMQALEYIWGNHKLNKIVYTFSVFGVFKIANKGSRSFICHSAQLLTIPEFFLWDLYGKLSKKCTLRKILHKGKGLCNDEYHLEVKCHMAGGVWIQFLSESNNSNLG